MTEPVKSTNIGVEQLVYAPLTDEALNTYGAVIPVSPLINVKITPKVNTDNLYADNQAIETVSVIGEIDVEVEVSCLPLEVQAGFFGHTLDTVHGVLTHSVDDVVPYVALGFKIKKANNHYRYVWLLKGKFEEMPDEVATQEDKVKFSTGKIKGTFVSRSDGNYKYSMDEDSATTPLTTFLTTVYVPTI